MFFNAYKWNNNNKCSDKMEQELGNPNIGLQNIKANKICDNYPLI